MRETMSEKELEKMRDLQAKAKRIQRHDAEFFEEVEERKGEVLEKLGASDKGSDDLSDKLNAELSDTRAKLEQTEQKVAELTAELEEQTKRVTAFEQLAEAKGTDLKGLYTLIKNGKLINSHYN